MDDFNSYIGKSFDVLRDACHASGKSIRITVLNGKPCVITRDVNINRLNVIVTNGIVVAIGAYG